MKIFQKAKRTSWVGRWLSVMKNVMIMDGGCGADGSGGDSDGGDDDARVKAK